MWTRKQLARSSVVLHQGLDPLVGQENVSGYKVAKLSSRPNSLKMYTQSPHNSEDLQPQFFKIGGSSATQHRSSSHFCHSD